MRERLKYSLAKITNLPGSWISKEVKHAQEKGIISDADASGLLEQIQRPAVARQVSDIFHCTVTARALSYPLSALVGWYGYANNNPELVIYAAATHIPVIPKISIAGILRTGYLAGRMVQDWSTEKDRSELPSIKTELITLAIAPFTPFGNFAAPLRARKAAGPVAGFVTGTIGRKMDDIEKESERLFPLPKLGQYHWVNGS